VNHNVAVRDEQKEPVQAQAAIEVDVAKENAKAWDILVTKNKKTNQESPPPPHPPTHGNVQDTGAQVLIAPAVITAMLLVAFESIDCFKSLMTSTTKSLRDKVLRALVGKDGLTAAGHTQHTACSSTNITLLLIHSSMRRILCTDISPDISCVCERGQCLWHDVLSSFAVQGGFSSGSDSHPHLQLNNTSSTTSFTIIVLRSCLSTWRLCDRLTA
jgi:hypothetical protein